jgi:hypothetical protein
MMLNVIARGKFPCRSHLLNEFGVEQSMRFVMDEHEVNIHQ